MTSTSVNENFFLLAIKLYLSPPGLTAQTLECSFIISVLLLILYIFSLCLKARSKCWWLGVLACKECFYVKVDLNCMIPGMEELGGELSYCKTHAKDARVGNAAIVPSGKCTFCFLFCLRVCVFQ